MQINAFIRTKLNINNLIVKFIIRYFYHLFELPRKDTHYLGYKFYIYGILVIIDLIIFKD